MKIKYTAVCVALGLVQYSTALAQNSFSDSEPRFVRVQTHAGQLDTDGILSPGEVPNPNIDYDHAQRRAERHGDERVENRDNDRAAAEDRYAKERADQERVRQEQYDRDHRDERRGWWSW